MSTRATYEIKSEQSITYYIHHDGYPSYAHNYFRNMLMAMGHCSRYTEAFLVGNPRQATITGGHEHHGDTEFRYTLWNYGKKLIVEELVDEPRIFTTIFEGNLGEFLDKYEAQQTA